MRQLRDTFGGVRRAPKSNRIGGERAQGLETIAGATVAVVGEIRSRSGL